MEKMDEQVCARVGMKIGLWFVSPAALVFLGFVVLKIVDVLFEHREGQRQNLKTGELYYLALLPLILGALYLSAAVLGRKAGKTFCRKARGSVSAALIGICVALGCLASAVLVWIISHFIALTITAPSFQFSDILFLSSLPAISALIYGLIPAIVLGILYGVLVRRRLAQAGWQKA